MGATLQDLPKDPMPSGEGNPTNRFPVAGPAGRRGDAAALSTMSKIDRRVGTFRRPVVNRRPDRAARGIGTILEFPFRLSRTKSLTHDLSGF